MTRSAAEWVVRERDAAFTFAEQQELAAWRAASPENETAYQAAVRVWELSGELADDPNVCEELAMLLRHHSVESPESGADAGLHHVRPTRSARAFTPAVALVAAVSVIAGIFAFWPKTLWHSTEIGARKDVVLPDESVLLLGTHSRVAVRYSLVRRGVVLERGEILVDVVHDTLRPFVIEAGVGSVRALGTRMNVVRENDTVTVTLLEGQARVQIDGSRARGAAVLDAGEAVAYAADGTQLRPDRRVASVERIEGWRAGTWPFDGWTVDEALREHNRYAVRPVQLSMTERGSERITGRFRIGETGAFVNAVAAAVDGTAVETEKAIVLVPRQATARDAPPR